jgi:hypothetical protein
MKLIAGPSSSDWNAQTVQAAPLDLLHNFAVYSDNHLTPTKTNDEAPNSTQQNRGVLFRTGRGRLFDRA